MCTFGHMIQWLFSEPPQRYRIKSIALHLYFGLDWDYEAINFPQVSRWKLGYMWKILHFISLGRVIPIGLILSWLLGNLGLSWVLHISSHFLKANQTSNRIRFPYLCKFEKFCLLVLVLFSQSNRDMIWPKNVQISEISVTLESPPRIQIFMYAGVPG